MKIKDAVQDRVTCTCEVQACQADAVVIVRLLLICDSCRTVLRYTCHDRQSMLRVVDQTHPQSIQPHEDTVVSEWFCRFLFLPRLGLWRESQQGTVILFCV